MDLLPYKKAYLAAATQRLNEFQDKLAGLAQNTQDKAIISELHRHIHSLGSQSYAMGYKSTGEYARIIEEYFYKLKHKNLIFNTKNILTLNDAVQKIRNSLVRIEMSDSELNLEADQQILKEVLEL